MKAILGKKVGMSQIFDKQGNQIPVTIIEAGPCMVIQVKNKEKDGYNAIQIGYKKAKRLNKPQKGHLKGLGEEFKYLKEIRLKELGIPEKYGASRNKELVEEKEDEQNEEKKEKDEETKKSEEVFDLNNLKRKDKFNVSIFTEGEKVDILGMSKGKGFTGVVKRHGFKKGPETHGSRHHREPGSIGSMFPQRVVKGKKLPGRAGGEQVTIKNLQVIKIDPDKNMLAVGGAVPGARGSLLLIKSQK